ncbi:phosphotransferase [Candidatus Woesearchaeota archaeon]|nr:phosphotransferase [Candidatus Woesearchaeota archaeon]
MQNANLSEKEYQRILKHWNIHHKTTHPDLLISGSPERSLSRSVIEDSSGSMYVLEQLDPNSIEQKKLINLTLCELSKHMDTINPYFDNSSSDRGAGECIVHDKGYWQISKYVHGERLPRPDYINDAWRGRAIAGFIKNLRREINDISGECKDKFSIFRLDIYIDHLLKQIKKGNPIMYEKLIPFAAYLRDNLFNKEIRMGLCHGDLHPENIIWGRDRILAVIDWEFLGVKPEIYDLANVVGCVGFEDPQALTGPLITEFLHHLENEFNENSWKQLNDMVLAIRFGWMSEWLRKKDIEMQELELAYMEILMKEKIRRNTFSN